MQVCGYGYDLLWSDACAAGSTAVIHAQSIVHENIRTASYNPNFNQACVAEGIILFERAKAGIPGVANGKPLFPVHPTQIQTF